MTDRHPLVDSWRIAVAIPEAEVGSTDLAAFSAAGIVVVAFPSPSPVAPGQAPVATSAATSPAAETAAAADSPEPNDGGKVGTDAFTPPTLTVPAGTIVTWTNRDTLPHTATATGGAFDSGNLDPGQSFGFAFDTSGTYAYAYACQYHSNMQGTIVVQ